MNKSRIQAFFIAIFLLLINDELSADYPKHEALRYRIQIKDSISLEISSGILVRQDELKSCSLKFETKSDNLGVMRLKNVSVALENRKYLIPLQILSSDRSLFEITPVFSPDDQVIAYAMRFGEGEFYYTRIVSINTGNDTLSYEDLEVSGKVRFRSKWIKINL